MRRTALASLAVAVLAALAVGCAVVAASEYAHPEALASTEWLADHLDDPTVRVIAMSDFRLPTFKDSYTAGHIPGAIYLNGMIELSNPESAVPMIVLPPEGFEALMGASASTAAPPSWSMMTPEAYGQLGCGGS